MFWYVQEVEVNDEDIIQQLMEHSNANRSTGSTGANSESSRSHSIMQVLCKLVCANEPPCMHLYIKARQDFIVRLKQIVSVNAEYSKQA